MERWNIPICIRIFFLWSHLFPVYGWVNIYAAKERYSKVVIIQFESSSQKSLGQDKYHSFDLDGVPVADRVIASIDIHHILGDYIETCRNATEN